METIICTYKEEQKIKTELRKQHLINSGIKFVNIQEYENMLLMFGLKLVIKDSLKYYNTMNSHLGAWLECTPEAIDETNFSFANINGKFYKEEIKRESQKYLNFRQFRRNYFTQLKTGHLIEI
jgi:hypothetical protein